MKNQKHTPGPWKVFARPETPIKDSPTSFDSDTAYFLGDLSSDSGEGGQLDDEREANARLIAAAPEMLEALENILRLAESLASSKFHDAKFAEVARVIAKARGES